MFTYLHPRKNVHYVVVCENGQRSEPFERRSDACKYAEWGHACTANHAIEPVDVDESATRSEVVPTNRVVCDNKWPTTCPHGRTGDETATVGVDGRTLCCSAYTSISIDDGVEYCKCCYAAVGDDPPFEVVGTLVASLDENGDVDLQPYVAHRWIAEDGDATCVVCGAIESLVNEDEADGSMIGCPASEYSAAEWTQEAEAFERLGTRLAATLSDVDDDHGPGCDGPLNCTC